MVSTLNERVPGDLMRLNKQRNKHKRMTQSLQIEMWGLLLYILECIICWENMQTWIGTLISKIVVMKR